MQDGLLKYLDLLASHYRSKSSAKISVFTLKNKKHEGYMDIYSEYYEKHKAIIYEDVIVAAKEQNTEEQRYRYLDNIYNISNEEILEPLILHAIIDAHIFFRLFKMQYYQEKQLTNIEDIIKYNEDNRNMWLRGQTNVDWQLIPSFFRSAKQTALWTWDEVYKDYQSKPQKNSLIKKLNEVDINTVKNPYKTAAFIQHSIAYSPLIDFTKSPQVALSFALSNGASMVDYYGDNACVYVLNISDYKILTELDEIDDAVQNFRVQVFKRNENIVNLITNKMWLDMLTFKVKSIIHLINKPTNDRMMFQKGIFILYDNSIIIGDEVFLSVDKVSFFGDCLTKYIIDKDSKESLYEALMKNYPQYHPRYLLDPYLYLGEPDK